MKRNLITLLTVTVMLMLALPVAAAPSATEPVICGVPQVSTLWGGKTIDVGTVTVSNDEANLYVTYQTTGDWYLTEAQLYVLDSEPMERLTPGQADYKGENLGNITSYTFVVPLADLDFAVTCGETALWLQAHATVVMLDEYGDEVGEGETAYGGDVTEPDQGSWYGNIMYVVQCCEEPPAPCYEFVDETAWAFGPNYIGAKQWAMYVEYYGEEKTVDLIAGKNMVVGTVHFSAPIGESVIITVNLTGDWEFAPVSENVKIQDYASAPSGNPAVGLFVWKGTATDSDSPFQLAVPWNSFYGVHVDVGYWVEVPCPVE